MGAGARVRPCRSGAEYLYNTVCHLETFGIHDCNLWRLQQLVADEIRSIHSHRIANRDAAENIEAVII
ncbi:hypothetical protein ACVOMV_21100 [Mesorhizobium atlanticum]